MKKRTIALVILLSVLLALILNIFVGGYIRAKISQIPQLSRFDFLNVEAPIVITRREVVRADDGTDLFDAINNSRAKLAAIVAVTNGQTVRTGNAINITADGSFVTVRNSFANTSATYAIVLDDGRIASVEERVTDPATDLVFFKANVDNIPVASFGNSKDLSVGQRLVLIEQTLKDFSPIATPYSVTSAQLDVHEQVFEANAPSRSFGIESVSGHVNGAASVNLSGDIVGMWNGSRIVSGDVIKRAISLYLGDELDRPNFGFAYDLISTVRSKLLGIPEGARVARVADNSPADTAGLQSGDIITAVGEMKLDEEVIFEEVLENYGVDKIVPLTITRGQKTLIINLTTTALK